jgi:hypothetical protein
MTHFQFDDSKIQWHKLGDFEHFVYAILDIDEENAIVDWLIKLEAHKPIVLHRHMALNKMLVIQGEHIIYHADGNIKEVRPTGTYTTSPPSDEPHRESGGDGGAVVFFSIRGSNGVFYEVLDDQQNLIATLGMQDFVELHAANLK